MGVLMEETVRVYKLNPDGSEKLHYDGVVLRRTATEIVLRAPWVRGEYPLGYVTFEPGDVFVEYFYADRWYNVFAIHGADGRFKGWYSNVTRPAVFGPGEVRAEDLALDVWVWPDRRMLVLDEDEFAALELTPEEQSAARAALEEIQRRAWEGEEPFDQVSS